jgi:hypothetical protein
LEKEKQKALEAAGYHVGNAEDFLGLTQQESALIELRMAVIQRIRDLRKRSRLTQQQLGERLHSNQSRVAKMEAGAKDVSLDFLFRGLFAVGGSLEDLTSGPHVLEAKVVRRQSGKGRLGKSKLQTQ